MNTVTGVIGFCESGKYFCIPKTAAPRFNLELTSTEWYLGLDPASKFTGIALCDINFKAIILLDYKRDIRVSKEQYFDDLYYLLKRLLNGIKVKAVVNEKPFTAGFSRASDVLIALRGKIDGWVREIPALQSAEYNLIYPQTWKSQVIDKSKGKNRFNTKGAVAEDLCDRFPVLREYKNSLLSGDLDSFDALGLIVGYIKSAYTADGLAKISGMKEGNHVSTVTYYWARENDLDSNFSNRIFGEFGVVFKPKYLVYNDAYSLVDNVVMASSNYDCVYTILPEKELQQFQWKLGIDITENGRCLVMFIFRKGHYGVNEMRWVQNNFEWVEEVRG